MSGILLINNHKFLSIVQACNRAAIEFVEIVTILRELSYTFILEEDAYLSDIFYELHRNSSDENIRIISRLIEKSFVFCEKSEYIDYQNRLEELIKIESPCFEEILNKKGVFHFSNLLIGHSLLGDNGIRNIWTLDDLKQVLLLFCYNIHEPKTFIDEVKMILADLIFDSDIVESMNKLSSGFRIRLREIIYHLYTIDKEIPQIILAKSSYQDIGDSMTLDCTPERKRKTVDEQLKKNINGINVNCELHTKMEKLSADEADRIYFCPALPNGTGKDIEGKIFIYKITKHV